MGKECSQTGPKPEETLLTAASRRMKSASDLACDVHSEGNDSCVCATWVSFYSLSAPLPPALTSMELLHLQGFS